MAEIIVLGGGIIGLTAAVRLQQTGLDVTVWSPVGPEHTVSSVAAAVWYPTRTEYDPRVRDWGAASYAEYTRQAAAGVPGVLLRPTRNLEPAWSDEPPWWAPDGTTTARAEPPYGREVKFLAPLTEMDVYLPWLRAQVPVENRGVDRLADGAYELIDYKTGRPKRAADLREDVQLALYSIAATRAWDLEAQTLLERVCRTAAGNLTEDSWARYVGGTTYEPLRC